MFNKNLKHKLSETEEELKWWQGYAGNIESGIQEIRDLANDSNGVAGYHLNGELATWDELLDDSLFRLAEDDIKDRKKHEEFCRDLKGIRSQKIKKHFYVKQYKNMPWQIHFNPNYGGIKYTLSQEGE